jgi:hypothetical protein
VQATGSKLLGVVGVADGGAQLRLELLAVEGRLLRLHGDYGVYGHLEVPRVLDTDATNALGLRSDPRRCRGDRDCGPCASEMTGPFMRTIETVGVARVAPRGLATPWRLVLSSVLVMITACGSSKTDMATYGSSKTDMATDGSSKTDAATDGSKTDAASVCQSLQAKFFAALPMAQSCGDTKLGGQCQTTVPYLSIGCSSPICLVAVNDVSALMPIESQWDQLGCSQIPGYVCVDGCRVARTGICSPVDGGSVCDPTP